MADRRPADTRTRVQFHLGKTLIERLGVHCSLTHQSQSAVVGEVLLAHLTRFGRGRELFKSAEDLGGSDEASPPT